MLALEEFSNAELLKASYPSSSEPVASGGFCALLRERSRILKAEGLLSRLTSSLLNLSCLVGQNVIGNFHPIFTI